MNLVLSYFIMSCTAFILFAFIADIIEIVKRGSFELHDIRIVKCIVIILCVSITSSLFKELKKMYLFFRWPISLIKLFLWDTIIVRLRLDIINLMFSNMRTDLYATGYNNCCDKVVYDV